MVLSFSVCQLVCLTVSLSGMVFISIYLCYDSTQTIDLKNISFLSLYICLSHVYTRNVRVVMVGNERGDSNSNPGRKRLHFI